MEIPNNLLGRFATLLWLGLAGCLLPGCGGNPTPTRLEAEIIAADDVNRDADGRALPIVVRLYELKAIGGFRSSDFYSLYDREADVLGADLLAREELNLRPGQRHRIERATAPDARHLGVLGAFRAIDNARWKTTHPLTPDTLNKVEIRLGASAVSIR